MQTLSVQIAAPTSTPTSAAAPDAAPGAELLPIFSAELAQAMGRPAGPNPEVVGSALPVDGNSLPPEMLRADIRAEVEHQLRARELQAGDTGGSSVVPQEGLSPEEALQARLQSAVGVWSADVDASRTERNGSGEAVPEVTAAQARADGVSAIEGPAPDSAVVAMEAGELSVDNQPRDQSGGVSGGINMDKALDEDESTGDLRDVSSAVAAGGTPVGEGATASADVAPATVKTGKAVGGDEPATDIRNIPSKAGAGETSVHGDRAARQELFPVAGQANRAIGLDRPTGEVRRAKAEQDDILGATAENLTALGPGSSSIAAEEVLPGAHVRGTDVRLSNGENRAGVLTGTGTVPRPAEAEAVLGGVGVDPEMKTADRLGREGPREQPAERSVWEQRVRTSPSAQADQAGMGVGQARTTDSGSESVDSLQQTADSRTAESSGEGSSNPDTIDVAARDETGKSGGDAEVMVAENSARGEGAARAGRTLRTPSSPDDSGSRGTERQGEQATGPRAAAKTESAAVEPGRSGKVAEAAAADRRVAGESVRQEESLRRKVGDKTAVPDEVALRRRIAGADAAAGKGFSSLLADISARLEMISLPAQAAPATTSSAQQSPPSLAGPAGYQLSGGQVPNWGLGQAFGSPGWEGAMHQRIQLMVGRQISRAEIRLDPPELGRIHVQLSLNQDQASLTFTSPNPQVREALEQQMPRLREMLAESGLQLADSDVSDRHPSGGRDEQEPRGDRVGVAASPALENTAGEPYLQVPLGLLDAYA